MSKINQNTLGVIVARFQVAALHAGHEWLIRHVASLHETVVIVLGTTIVKGSTKNPLNYQDRVAMLQNSNVIKEITAKGQLVFMRSLADQSSDSRWSENLDLMLDELVNQILPEDSISPFDPEIKDTKRTEAVLYGARESFIPYYSGYYQTQVLEVPEALRDTGIYSGTATRKLLKENPPHTEDYRAGKIIASSDLYPINYMCVDAVIYNKDKGAVLLGRKPSEDKFRFIGGFTDPTDESLEAAAIREAGEEVVYINHDGSRHPLPLVKYNTRYLGSLRINDPRYRGEPHQIMSAVILCFTENYANLIGSDDIAEVKWFSLEELSTYDIMEPHEVIVKLLKECWLLP